MSKALLVTGMALVIATFLAVSFLVLGPLLFGARERSGPLPGEPWDGVADQA